MVAGAVACVVGGALLGVRRRRVVALAGVMLVAAGAGLLSAHARMTTSGRLAEIARDVPRCSFEATVTEQLGGLGSLWSMDAIDCGGGSLAEPGSVVVDDAVADPGTNLRGEGWLIPLGSDGFDRARQRLGAQASLHLVETEIVDEARGAHGVARRVRDGLHTAVSDLDPRHAALIEGLTIGDTSGFAPETISQFRASGLSHVLAVSGSNVAIVVAAMLVALRGLSLVVRVAAGFAALCLFVLVVGPDASVLRAGVMGAATLLCLLRGRQGEPLAILALAVITVVGVRPAMLYSVGMHLSVAATAGIVLFSTPLSLRMSWLPEPLRVMLSATLAAQVAVAPILMLVFGEISVTAPLANFLALPVVGVATVVGLVAGCIAVLWAPLGVAVASLIAPAAWWIVSVAERFGGATWSAVEVPPEWGLLTGCVVVAAAIESLKRSARALSVG